MAEDEGALVLCLSVLRWSGLCFTKVQRTSRGHLVARDSALHLVINAAIAVAFSVFFFLLNWGSFESAAEAYKSSAIVYPLYTKLMIVIIVMFSLCGNFYNRRFVDLINLLYRVSRALGPVSGDLSTKSGQKVLLGFLTYMGILAGLSIWLDTQLVLRYDRTFRIVHHFCECYLVLFTVHFVLTMNQTRKNFGRLNATFRRIGRPKERLSTLVSAVSKAPPSIEIRIRACMAAFMDLREVEEMVNEIFGKQIFLTMVLAFSTVCVNAYYFITLNLYGTSYEWLNLTMCIGFLEAMMAAVVCTRAAELAVNEANRVNEAVLGSLLHFQDRQIHKQIQYFVLFTLYNPMKISAWIFYAVSYESLLKVILTTSAITALILQCDFLRASFRSPKNGTTAALQTQA